MMLNTFKTKSQTVEVQFAIFFKRETCYCASEALDIDKTTFAKHIP